MRFWRRLRKYEVRAPIRKTIMGVVRRELDGAGGAARNWVGKRSAIAAALVCGPQAAAARLADENLAPRIFNNAQFDYPVGFCFSG